MNPSDHDRPTPTFSVDPDAAQALVEHSVVRDLDRSGQPHFLVKVPELERAADAEVGIEVEREEDGCVALSVLLYDIPTEPVSYDLRLYPDDNGDLRFLRGILDSSHFRLHPCQYRSGEWEVGPPQVFRIPPNLILRLKHYSLEWPTLERPSRPSSAPPVEATPLSQTTKARSPDPRDTVIRKLKEQVQALRDQLQERDKRIIELEDELHELKSRGRSYRLSGEKRSWWKRF